ncbi:hypothetical protein, partial [uncultured Alistipes sp.]|uniref:hypothetical protein n=1 Tax=uncultured Alistipes sp. TaxID=538949 RepID=UPI0025D71C28
AALSLAAEKERREGGALKTGPVCSQTREGARFSAAERRSRESDMRMVLVLLTSKVQRNPAVADCA